MGGLCIFTARFLGFYTVQWRLLVSPLCDPIYCLFCCCCCRFHRHPASPLARPSTAATGGRKYGSWMKNRFLIFCIFPFCFFSVFFSVLPLHVYVLQTGACKIFQSSGTARTTSCASALTSAARYADSADQKRRRTPFDFERSGVEAVHTSRVRGRINANTVHVLECQISVFS